jgi:hypothetical protein
MFGGTLFFIIVGALYILFAFVEPPEAIATFFRVPVLVGPLLLLAPRGAPSGRPSMLGVLFVFLFLGVSLWARWRGAGEVAERRAQWQSFEILTRDPRFLHLQQHLYTRGYRTTFERAADPVTYRVAFLVLQDGQSPRLLAQHNPPARWLVAYLERDGAPKRVVVSLDLQSGACHEREAGLFDWGAIPARPIPA